MLEGPRVVAAALDHGVDARGRVRRRRRRRRRSRRRGRVAAQPASPCARSTAGVLERGRRHASRRSRCSRSRRCPRVGIDALGGRRPRASSALELARSRQRRHADAQRGGRRARRQSSSGRDRSTRTIPRSCAPRPARVSRSGSWRACPPWRSSEALGDAGVRRRRRGRHRRRRARGARPRAARPRSCSATRRTASTPTSRSTAR